jgi:hypothetical protein
MTVDKTALKKLIDKTKPADLQVHSYNHIDSTDHKLFLQELAKSIAKSDDYTVIVVKK